MYQFVDFTEIAKGEQSMQRVIFLFEVLLHIIAMYYLFTLEKLLNFSFR